MKTNDHPLGSTFELDGVTLVVALDQNDLTCNDCWFENRTTCKHPHCDGKRRADGTDVVFKKLSGHESVQG